MQLEIQLMSFLWDSPSLLPRTVMEKSLNFYCFYCLNFSLREWNSVCTCVDSFWFTLCEITDSPFPKYTIMKVHLLLIFTNKHVENLPHLTICHLLLIFTNKHVENLLYLTICHLQADESDADTLPPYNCTIFLLIFEDQLIHEGWCMVQSLYRCLSI